MTRTSSGIRLSLAAAAILLLLLVLLGTLQYKWIGEVSEAERERMAASARSAAEGVALDFDREIARLFYFALPSRGADADSSFAQAAKRWAAETKFRELVAAVFVAYRAGRGEPSIEHADLSSGRIEPAAWPPDLEEVRKAIENWPATWPGFEREHRLREEPGAARRQPPPGSPFVRVLDRVPAVVFLGAGVRVPDGPLAPDRVEEERWIIVCLDEAAIRTRFLPEVVRRHFGSLAEYDVAVLRAADPRTVLYRSREGFSPEKIRKADAEVALFAARPGLDLADRAEHRLIRFEEQAGTQPKRPRGPPPRGRVVFGGELEHGAWRLVANHRAGSLQAAVAATRRRNLAVSGGILLLLGATVAALATSAHCAQRLARQQVEFIAGLTHELRTPLAAVRSAGQNLADGVVTDKERVRQYGVLLEREGRRLSELIEEALAHAGIEARRNGARIGPIAIAGILEEAVSACRPLAKERDTSLQTQIARDLAPVMGDPLALRTLFENLVSNAIKYGGREGRVSVEGRREGRSIEVTVRDRGPGILPRDLPHIFEPFYRGGDASSERVAGSGLGLSLVRRIVEAHGGQVRVESEPGNGTTFCVSLPAAPEPSPGLTGAAQVAS